MNIACCVLGTFVCCCVTPKAFDAPSQDYRTIPTTTSTYMATPQISPTVMSPESSSRLWPSDLPKQFRHPLNDKRPALSSPLTRTLSLQQRYTSSSAAAFDSEERTATSRAELSPSQHQPIDSKFGASEASYGSVCAVRGERATGFGVDPLCSDGLTRITRRPLAPPSFPSPLLSKTTQTLGTCRQGVRSTPLLSSSHVAPLQPRSSIVTDPLTDINNLLHASPTSLQCNNRPAVERPSSTIAIQPKKKQRRKKFKVNADACLSPGNRSVDGTTVFYTRKTIPAKLKKYYWQRYSYFSRFDDGIMMDQEGWFSVTPEEIARHIAERCECNVVIDAFCGCGGNTIQFAFTCQQVIAIDIDPVKLHCAKNNARIYGVDHKVEFIHGDFFELAPRLKGDVVFLSPPWGGPSYSRADDYDLVSMMPGNGERIHAIASKITPNVVFYVPKNSDPGQLMQLGACDIERSAIQEHLKALTAYYGNLSLSCSNRPTSTNIIFENSSGMHEMS